MKDNTVQAGLQIFRTVHFLIESSDSKIYKVKTMATITIIFGGYVERLSGNTSLQFLLNNNA